jgi:hypothetical protein
MAMQVVVGDALPAHRGALTGRLEQKIKQVADQKGCEPRLGQVQSLLFACPGKEVDELPAEFSHESIVVA